jgi:formamidopyrimidine-DNA glycosylase
MGNIYTDECLHQAGIHPLARSDRIDDERVQRLHAAIRSTLRAAIQREGSSFDRFYRTPEGRPGSYQDQFRVYGRAGEPCRECGAPITRLVVGQRGTHFCRRCQKR